MPSRNDLEIDVIDKLSDYLESYAELPRHNLQKYRRPAAVLPEDCPLLCVWLVTKRFTPKMTNAFDSAVNVGVSWQIETVDRAVNLSENEEQARDMLRAMGEIQHRVKVLCNTGWPEGASVSEAYEVLPATVDYIPPMALDTGLIEGYSMVVQVNVVEQV